MADAETAILEALQATLLNPDVIEAAIHRAAARLTTDDSTSDTGAAQLRQLDTELARLTDAVAAGGDVPALVQAIRAREERRRELERQMLARPRAASMVDVATIVDDLRARSSRLASRAPWCDSGSTGFDPTAIVNRLTMEPTERGYRFSGEGTVRPILEGVVPATARLKWRPHREQLGSGQFWEVPSVQIAGEIGRRRRTNIL